MNHLEETIKEVQSKREKYWNLFQQTKKEYYKEALFTCVRILREFENLEEDEKTIKLEES